jgi:hypothetical protein
MERDLTVPKIASAEVSLSFEVAGLKTGDHAEDRKPFLTKLSW